MAWDTGNSQGALGIQSYQNVPAGTPTYKGESLISLLYFVARTGRLYSMSVSPFYGDEGTFRIRYTRDGSKAKTSSPLLTSWQAGTNGVSGTAQGLNLSVSGLISLGNTKDQEVWLGLTYQASSSSGGIAGPSGGDMAGKWWVEDIGADAGPTWIGNPLPKQ